MSNQPRILAPADAHHALLDSLIYRHFVRVSVDGDLSNLRTGIVEKVTPEYIKMRIPGRGWVTYNQTRNLKVVIA